MERSRFKRAQFDNIEAETLNGAIHANGQFNKVDLQTFNGQIICHNEKVDSESMKLNQ